MLDQAEFTFLKDSLLLILMQQKVHEDMNLIKSYQHTERFWIATQYCSCTFHFEILHPQCEREVFMTVALFPLY